MRSFFMVLVLALVALPVAAQTVQKCAGKGGAVAFRSGACEAGERLVQQRDGGSDVRSPEQWRQLRERQEAERQDSAYLSRAAGTDRSSYSMNVPAPQHNPKVYRCDAAKSERKRVLDLYKGRASLQMHSNLNHMVYDACKP